MYIEFLLSSLLFSINKRVWLILAPTKLYSWWKHVLVSYDHLSMIRNMISYINLLWPYLSLSIALYQLPIYINVRTKWAITFEYLVHMNMYVSSYEKRKSKLYFLPSWCIIGSGRYRVTICIKHELWLWFWRYDCVRVANGLPRASRIGAGVVNGTDLKSVGLWPHRFESCSIRRSCSRFPGLWVLRCFNNVRSSPPQGGEFRIWQSSQYIILFNLDFSKGLNNPDMFHNGILLLHCISIWYCTYVKCKMTEKYQIHMHQGTFYPYYDYS